MHWSCIFVLIITIVMVKADPGPACEQRQGCRLQQGQCLCGIGCASDYIYATKTECQAASRGRGNDVCQRSPCLNGGTCSQIAIVPGFKCHCEGTGFFGTRCQNGCPRRGSSNAVPFECIVI